MRSKMMNKMAWLLALLVPVLASAQENDFCGRASVGVDYKVRKGLHLSLEEEVRLEDRFTSLNRLQTSVGVSYKPVKYVKLAAGYTLINPYKQADKAFNSARHRFVADVTGLYRWGDFQFSLRERFQVTHRTGDFNKYEHTPNAMALKSRIGVKYKGFQKVDPFVSFEVRTALNDPWGNTNDETYPKKSGQVYPGFDFTGYTHLYNNRYRVQLGAAVALSKQHTIQPYLLLDSCSDYELDVNKTGEYLKSAQYVDSFNTTLGVSYVFSF